jgi:3-hydroxyacyl-[acyl-carrier-protein] dehydratase
MAATFEASDIARLLPHRDDALFVSFARVNGDEAHGEACWSRHHPVLQGHFPSRSIVPAVFLIEAAAQLAGILIASRNIQTPGLGMLAAVRKSLIHASAVADEKIFYSLRVSGNAQAMFSVRGAGMLLDKTKIITFDLLIAVKDLEV